MTEPKPWLVEAFGITALPGDEERLRLHWQADQALVTRALEAAGSDGAPSFFDRPQRLFDGLVRR
ncbi:hypothetical protein [Novosphingobium olei]|uniref:hypothetical protein n=1 Tax=Novosphingobium olei TaxID=2728851 RepID=UPI0030933E7A|nr:hypothetical protein NSDW_04720 [Novosphingobium olei]